jgi:RimJ/RimL family protein N-acetyltransferase
VARRRLEEARRLTSPEPWIPIQTERLTLRDFRSTDSDDVHAYASIPDVARYMPWGPNSPDDTREFLTRVLSEQSAWPRFGFDFAIELRATGRVIGSIGLHLRDGPNRTAELGYCLHNAAWRQGFVSEAAHALVDVGFRTLNLHRIIAICDARNTASFGLMEKVGMRREGLFRRDREIKDEWRDTFLYAVLADDWKSRKC